MVAKVALALSMVLAATVAAKAQQVPAITPNSEDQSAIRVSVNLVVLPVSVTDSHGQFVSRLKQDNFQVYEDGRPQKITVFGDEDLPATVGLVVDHSGSMRPIMPEVSEAAVAFAQSSNPKDEMFVVNFNDKVSLGLPEDLPFTSDTAELYKAVSGMKAEGRTALNDAILTALDHLRSAQLDRQALIIVSDGGDNISRHNFEQVLAAARASNTTIYSVGIFGPNDADKNPGMLEKLAKATGGKAYFPSSADEVVATCKQIARDIREQYTLGYSPSNTAAEGSFHRIEVKVNAPNLGKVHVRTRAGYIAQSQPQPEPVPVSSLGALGNL